MKQQPRPIDGRTADGAAAADATHVARSGVLQTLSVAGQALMPATHILIARLFGVATFGAGHGRAARARTRARRAPSLKRGWPAARASSILGADEHGPPVFLGWRRCFADRARPSRFLIDCRE